MESNNLEILKYVVLAVFAIGSSYLAMRVGDCSQRETKDV